MLKYQDTPLIRENFIAELIWNLSNTVLIFINKIPDFAEDTFLRVIYLREVKV